jgi:hypothetical protein
MQITVIFDDNNEDAAEFSGDDLTVKCIGSFFVITRSDIQSGIQTIYPADRIKKITVVV